MADEDRVINNYIVNSNDDGYVSSFYAVLDDEYNYTGQMADFPDACEGWYKFIPGDRKGEGEFVVDEEKKAEIIAEREAEALKPTEMDELQAQVLWTALMTDTLIEENE